MNSSVPRSIGVALLHPGCNMTCTFCVTDNAVSAMDFDQALALLDALEARGIGGVVLGGGEPFTWAPGVLRLARVAKARGFQVQIGTNGVRLPEGYEQAPGVDRYVLPLESTKPGVHNRMRVFGAGHHAIILDRLAELAAAGKAVTVSTVVTSENIEDLPEVGVYLADYVLSGGRLHAWHLYRFIPEGRGGGPNGRRLWTPESDYDTACAEVRAMDLGFTIFKRRDMRHSKTVDFFWYQGGALQVGSEIWGEEDPQNASFSEWRQCLAPE